MSYNTGKFQEGPDQGDKGVPYDIPYGNTYSVAPPQIKLPKYLQVKKWILLSIIICNILGLIGAILYIDALIDLAIKMNPSIKPDDIEDIKDLTKNFMLGFLIFCTLLELLFLHGIAKQNLCLSTTYAVLSILCAFSMVLRAVPNPAGWANALVFCGVAYLSYSYTTDLRILRDNRVRLGLDVI